MTAKQKEQTGTHVSTHVSTHISTYMIQSGRTKGAPIQAAQVRELLSYDTQTGILYWNRRTPEQYTASPNRSPERKAAEFNTRYARKAAGSILNVAKSGLQYRAIYLNSRTYYAHRLAYAIINGEWPDDFLDHLNGNGLDNRWCNLVEATPTQNMRNKKKHSNNTSGITGVSLSKTGSWIARLSKAHIGTYATREQATAARLRAEQEHGYTGRHGL